MDFEPFFEEARRVLKPGGVLAVYGYGHLTLDKPDAAEAVKQVNITIYKFFSTCWQSIDPQDTVSR